MQMPKAMSTQIDLWILHEFPEDFPDEYVARRWVYQKNAQTATEHIVKSKSIDMVRQALRSKGLMRWQNPPRDPDRSPHIVEFWSIPLGCPPEYVFD